MDEHRIVVAACGTKFGKTLGLSVWLTREAWNTKQALVWWCAPTIRQARIAFNMIGLWLPKERVGIHRSDANLAYDLLYSDGTVHSTIAFRSADNPASLRGDGVHAAVVDEAGYWDRASYTSVWTTLTRTRGKLRVISTPKGRNWFFDEWSKGTPGYTLNGEVFPEYSSYCLPTASNPYVPPEAIEEARRNLPADVFQQEYEARFLDESAGVFRNIIACQTAAMRNRPQPGRRYAIGVDFAKHSDFTVIMVGDVAAREIVHIERYNDVDWTVNEARTVKCARDWNNAAILIDATGVGDVVFDHMRAAYGNTFGYNIATNAAKQALVQKTQMAFERTDIKIPKPGGQNTAEMNAMAGVLQQELQMFGYTMTPQGRMQYSAPDGYHDDAVTALCLLYWQMTEEPFVYRAKSVAGL